MPVPLTPVMKDLVPTGIPGLDDVLNGGFTANRVYLVEGNPGSGKTTMAMQLLLQGEQHQLKSTGLPVAEADVSNRARIRSTHSHATGPATLPREEPRPKQLPRRATFDVKTGQGSR